MKKSFIIVLVSTLLVGASAFSFAAGEKSSNATTTPATSGPIRKLIQGQVGKFFAMKSELNLTDDQKQKIREIVLQHKQEIAAVAKPLSEKHRALRSAAMADQSDDKAIRAAADDMAKSIGDAAILAAKIKAEVRTVLTPTQQQKVQEFRKSTEDVVDQVIGELAH